MEENKYYYYVGIRNTSGFPPSLRVAWFLKITPDEIKDSRFMVNLKEASKLFNLKDKEIQDLYRPDSKTIEKAKSLWAMKMAIKINMGTLHLFYMDDDVEAEFFDDLLKMWEKTNDWSYYHSSKIS
jgi:hypothetical protein